MKNFWKRLKRCISLESKYLIKKISFYRFFLLIISLVQVIVISLGDVQAFFLSNSIIPKEWTFFKNPTNARVISILFVIIIYLLIGMADTIQKSKEISELTVAIKN